MGSPASVGSQQLTKLAQLLADYTAEEEEIEELPGGGVVCLTSAQERTRNFVQREARPGAQGRRAQNRRL